MKGEHDMNEDDDAFDERGLLKSGRSIRVRMTMMDGRTAVVDCGLGGPHRPGFRRLVNEAAQDARARAYDEMVKRTEGAWKSEAQRIAESEQAAGPPLSEDPREDAYLRNKKWLENAWSGSR